MEEGAAREAREELNADIHVGELLALYSLPHIGQMYYIGLVYVSHKRFGRLKSTVCF